MQYIRKVAVWIIGFVIALSTVATRTIEAEIPDDLKSSLECIASYDSSRLMPEEKVKQILNDKLDRLPQKEISSFAQHILLLCKKFKLDPALILSVIQVESNFKVRAKSHMGAVGLMQVMPHTARHVLKQLKFHWSGHEDYNENQLSQFVIHSETLMNPYLNTAVGIAYLAWLRDYYQGSAYHVLAAYNLGPAKMDSLIARKHFKPVASRKYYFAVRQGVSSLRMYDGTLSKRRKKLNRLNQMARPTRPARPIRPIPKNRPIDGVRAYRSDPKCSLKVVS